MTFDIRAGMWALDHELTVYTTRNAVYDTIRREVHLNALSFPVATMRRLTKYQSEKDFTIPSSTYRDFVVTAGNMDIEDDSQLALYID